MAKKAFVYDGSQWIDIAQSTADLSTYQKSNRTGLQLVVPTGATNGTVGANGAVTIGNAVSSVTVNGAFNSTYDAYKILISGGTSSVADRNLNIRLDGSTSGYYYSFIYGAYTGGSLTNAAGSNVNGITYVGSADTNGISADITVNNPFLAKWTTFSAGLSGPTIAGPTTGNHQVATSYTGFVITPNTGTLTGGTIRVYGYNNGV